MTVLRRDVPAGAPTSTPRTVRASRRGSSAEIENRIAIGLGLVAVVVVLFIALFPTTTPFTTLMIPVVVGSIVLGPRTLPRVAGVVLVCLVAAVALQDELTGRLIGSALVQVAIIGIALFVNHRRGRLGVAGSRGESMFVDLRDRILSQCEIPEVPPGWLVESSLTSAGGTPFAGDFVVSARPQGTQRLAIVLVDVSGKGEEAGTRALLLSGAMAGLIGAMPARELLRASNDYLVQHGWEEGFASAIHLSLDLRTGAYEVRAAGHPPAVHRDAGSGRWQVLPTEGPVLGVIDRADFPVVRGRLDRGDVLMLYTDGLVEDSSRDIDLGIDRMLGHAEATLRGTYEGGADRLLSSLGSADDDRALVLVHRR